MKDWYILSIEGKKRGNMEIYKKTLMDLFAKELSWSEVKKLNNDQQIKLMVTLERNIKIAKSPFDIKKLATAIQHSRSGAGGCAMTKYKCAFCGIEETWGNTAVPKICRNCATKMAEGIVLRGIDIMKS
ncbi:hypothetical protein KDN24_06785 [Bacillus sp. Bva_UNVM-123]|uniref:hypothetical protein n=1 Tax=Bacillus sp. Bva_UNVM-123 TaxID=2829798 RepID=UPI00391F30E6